MAFGCTAILAIFLCNEVVRTLWNVNKMDQHGQAKTIDQKWPCVGPLGPTREAFADELRAACSACIINNHMWPVIRCFFHVKIGLVNFFFFGIEDEL